MSRSLVSLRTAVPADAPVLAVLWAEALRRVDHEQQVRDLEQVVAAAGSDPRTRLVVAEYDGEPAGAVLLKVATLTPLNLEPTVQIISPHVFEAFRRRGIGRALMDAAVSFAEELDIDHVVSAAVVASRDANRFMARLALGPHATMRIAPTAVVRAKLAAQRPSTSTHGGRQSQVTRVLAVRRSLRRAQRSQERPVEGAPGQTAETPEGSTAPVPTQP